MSEERDPFQSYDKTPAVSFAGKGEGYTTRLTVMEVPKLVQARNFDTGRPDVWKNKDGTESPKMAAVIKVEEDGQTRSLWAVKPSSLFAAIRAAQADSGQRIAVGDVLVVEITEVQEPKRKGGKGKKEYGAEHIPADAFESPSDEIPY